MSLYKDRVVQEMQEILELQVMQEQGLMLYLMVEQVLVVVEEEVATAAVSAVIQVAALGVAETVEVEVHLEILEI
jgi:hypothetical protein